MKVFKYQREKTFGTHNFDLFQVYVCKLIDANGSHSMGISILPVNGVAEIPFLLTKDQTRELMEVLRNSASEILPQSFFRGTNVFSKYFGLQFTFIKVKNDKLYGRLIPGISASGQYINVKSSSLLSCANSLQELIDNA
jgi:hypothetical protein